MLWPLHQPTCHTRRLRSRPPTKGLLVARLLLSWYILFLVIPHPVKITISCIAMSDGLTGKKSQFNGENPYLGIPTIYLDAIFAGMCPVNMERNTISLHITLWCPVFWRNIMAGGELFEICWCFLCFHLLLFTLYGNIYRTQYSIVYIYSCFAPKRRYTSMWNTIYNAYLFAIKGISDMGLLWPGVV